MSTTDAGAGIPAADIGAGEALLDLLNGFIGELRLAGLPVSLTENLDAMEAVQHIPLDDREAFKYALAATLVKNHAHWRAFETVFEVYFSLRGAEFAIGDDDAVPLDLDQDQDGEASEGGGQGEMQGGAGDALTPEELAEMLYQALLQGDNAMMRAMARQAVKRYAGMEPGRPVGGTYYLYRTMRNLDLDGDDRNGSWSRPARTRRSRSRRSRSAWSTTSTSTGSDQLKKEIEAEIRRRLVADRGVEAMAKTLRKPLPEDVDFMHASREEMISPAQGAAAAHPAPGGAPGPQAPPRAQGRARLPPHRARTR